MISILAFSAILSVVRPMEDLRFEWIHEQRLDYSCGVSALAGLAGIYWRIETDEDKLLKLLPELTPPRTETTVLDLASIAESLGFESAAYRVSLSALTQTLDMYGPVIVHLDEGEGHFVLVVGYQDGIFTVGDPSEGCSGWPTERFCSTWSGVALAVRHDKIGIWTAMVESACRETAARIERLSRWSAR